VVDSSSTNKTKEIALRYNARLIQHKFEGYIEQKNWATEQATYDYVLLLDANEQLSDTLKASIAEVKQNWTHDGYTFNRLTNYCGRWMRYTSWRPSRTLRLYNRRMGQWAGTPPHDALVMKKGARIKHLKGNLLHYSFHTIGQQITQINKFSELQAEAFYYKGYSAGIFSILLKPLWRFFWEYFIKLGILDGFYGFVVSVNAAYEVYLKYTKLKKIIEFEKTRTPHRVCFFTSNVPTRNFEFQYITDIKTAEEHCTQIVLFSSYQSGLIQECKKAGIHCIEKRIKFYVWLGPLFIYPLYRIFERLRIRAFVVNNLFDAQLIHLCIKFGLKAEIYYHIGEKPKDEEKVLRYISAHHPIKKILINHGVPLSNSHLPASKLVYLSNNRITLEHLRHQPKVAILLDKIHRPNCGLGRVSIDFSKALSEQAAQNNFIEFSYLVYGENEPQHLKSGQVFRLKDIHRFIPAHYDNFDILHILHQAPAFRVACSGKKVLTIHDLNFLFTKSKRKARRYLKEVQHMVNNADAVVFISQFTRKVCEQHLKFYPHQILRVIYNGVKLPQETPQRPDFLNFDEPYLFTIGQCLPKKNFHVLIPFVKRLEGRYRLIIAGENDTAYGLYLRKLVEQYNLQNTVILPGPVSEAEKQYLYQHCTAFVFPSLAEGFGLPVIEAMLNHKPVFCSDRTSLKEIGSTHVFFWQTFEPADMKAVFEYGMSVFDDARSAAAYAYAQQFSWQKNAQEYYKLYKELLQA
jgi:glycosyltransferase involved in cell wall biosynthesis